MPTILVSGLSAMRGQDSGTHKITFQNKFSSSLLQPINVPAPETSDETIAPSHSSHVAIIPTITCMLNCSTIEKSKTLILLVFPAFQKLWHCHYALPLPSAKFGQDICQIASASPEKDLFGNIKYCLFCPCIPKSSQKMLC